MEFFLTRYRNLCALLVAILAQLALLAYQVKSNQDVRLIRVWAVTAVTPLARVIEASRGGLSGFFHNYFVLLDVRQENKRLKAELDREELENQYLRAEVSSSDRAKALAIFQATSQSKTVAARVILYTPDTGGKTVIIDRGASSGIQKGVGVVTPEGIVGKVIDVYPNAANVLLITDATFAAGVVSKNNRVHGVLKGQGHSTVMVDYVPNEQRLDPGEDFLTSGDDGIFPRGYEVGQATAIRAGRSYKDILVAPSGLQNGLDVVLVIIDGVHGTLPETPVPNQSVRLLPPPPGDAGAPSTDASVSGGSTSGAAARSTTLVTDLDRQVQQTKAIGASQNHKFGDKFSPAPNFNADPSHPPGGSRPHP